MIVSHSQFYCLIGLIGGLGLYCLGLDCLSRGLIGLFGRHLRDFLRNFSRSRFHAFLGGLYYGFSTQSDAVTASMAAGYTATGVMAPASAAIIVMCGQLGPALVALLLCGPFWHFGFLLLGVAAVFHYYGPRRGLSRHLTLLGLGVGMLLAGLDLFSDTLLALTPASVPGLGAITARTATGAWLAALAGCAVTALTRSSTVTLGVALALAAAGWIGPETAMAVALGEGVGHLLTDTPARDTGNPSAQRVVLLPRLFQSAGALLALAFLPIYAPAFSGMASFLLEELNLDGLLAATHVTPEAFLATFTVGFSYACFHLALSLGFLPVARLADAGTTAAPSLAAGGLIRNVVTTDPDTAMDLLEKEASLLLTRCEEQLAAARAVIEGAAETPAAEGLAERQTELAAAIRQWQEAAGELMDFELSRRSAARLMNLSTRVNLIEALTGHVAEFARGLMDMAAVQPLASVFLESLDAILLTAIEAAETRTVENVGTLRSVTEDHGETIERIRKTYMQNEGKLGGAERAALFKVIGNFERCVASLHRLGEFLAEADSY